MTIKLPDATVTLSDEEQYVLTLILQSAKRQMEEWQQAPKAAGRPDIPSHYQIVCALLEKVDPPNPKQGGQP
jgi:hypothetical protein